MRKNLMVLGILLISAIALVLIALADSTRGYPFGIESQSERFIQGSTAIAGGYKDAEFEVQVPDFFATVNSVKMTVTTRPLEVSGDFASFGVPNTPTVVDPFFMFDVQYSPNYPSDITVMIDGVDQTGNFDGPWNADAGNTPVRVRLDLTHLITDASGGVYQLHKVTFRAGYKVANGAIANHPAIKSNASNGIIEVTTFYLGAVRAGFIH